jgi:hypothetical protein
MHRAWTLPSRGQDAHAKRPVDRTPASVRRPRIQSYGLRLAVTTARQPRDTRIDALDSDYRLADGADTYGVTRHG